ncbi:MAG: hypothetical protein QGG53_35845 [Planctomycetota bacterium]|jgi:hypothetical protein|nr:hypothetical protein [Planctomycetota bacterium]
MKRTADEEEAVPILFFIRGPLHPWSSLTAANRQICGSFIREFFEIYGGWDYRGPAIYRRVCLIK